MQYRFMQMRYSSGSVLDGEEETFWSLDENIYNRLKEKEQRMLEAIDRGVLELGDTDERDLEAVF